MARIITCKRNHIIATAFIRPPQRRNANRLARSPITRMIRPSCISKTGPYRSLWNGIDKPLMAGKMIKAWAKIMPKTKPRKMACNQAS